MEIHNLQFHPMIIPAVLIPLTAMSVALSALATFIAGLFGITLRAEGPKKLLEVLLKPKILISGIIGNLLIVGGIKGWDYYKNLPRFERTVISENRKLQTPSTRIYTETYEQTPRQFPSLVPASHPFNIEVKWKGKAEKGSFRGGVVSGESVFIGTEGGTIDEKDIKTGKAIRSFFVGNCISPAPVIWKNFMFVGEGSHATHHARIYKFDLTTGAYVGAFQTLGHTEGQAVFGNYNGKTQLFVVAGSDGLHAVNPEDLKEIWHANDGHIDAAVRVNDGIVFSATGRDKGDSEKNRSYAVAYDFLTGKTIWKHELPASSWMQPIAVGEQICYVYGEVYFKSEIGGIACFHQKSGETMTSYFHGVPIAATPIAIGSNIFIADFYGKICRVSLETGRKIWCSDTQGKDYSLANVSYDPDNGVLVYPSMDKGLFVLNPENGKILLNWLPDGKSWPENYAPALITKDGWLVADMSGDIRMLKPVKLVK